ncbi:MAG: VOC family protein [Acholeplasmataceae bacterium]|nr:VOC family protein [Acholeplasmataceae bacterium]
MSKYHNVNTLHFTEITLLVRDFNRSLEFYIDILGFSLIKKETHLAVLSANLSDPLITLIEDRNAQPLDFTLGLYHYALLLPNRRAFAKMIKELTHKHYPVSGMSDHGVSEAIYLDDPDGNGIEIYWDRPDNEWPYENNQLTMFTKKLNLDGVMSSLEPDEPTNKIDPLTIIGHLHFYVNELDEAKVFYADALGFSPMMHYMDSALFISSAGYHHHLGLNTWNGSAPISKERQVGLKSAVLNIPENEYLNLMRRLMHHHIPLLNDNGKKYIIDILGQKIYLDVK